MRPHCQARDACAAKGDGHCRRCAGLHAMGLLRADPAFAERLIERARAASPSARAVFARSAKRLMTDPAVRAANLRGRVERTARLADIPLELVPLFRRLRKERFTRDEARSVLVSSFPDRFDAAAVAPIARHRRFIARSAGLYGVAFVPQVDPVGHCGGPA